MSMIGWRDRGPSPKFACRSGTLIESNVFKVQSLIVNSARRRSNPIRKLARFHDSPAHQRLDVGIILGIREPFEFVALPRLFAQDFSIGAYKMPCEIADLAMEALVWQGQPEWNARIINHPLPAANSIGNLIDVVIAQAFVQRRQCRHAFGDDSSAHNFRDWILRV